MAGNNLSHKRPALSIIILNYNTKQITLDAIASIEKNYLQEVSIGEYEVIVVDNESPDNSLEAFKEYKKKTKIKTFHVVASGGNIGFSAGNNKGVPFAKGKYVLFLNSDTIVSPKTLSYMLDFMESHPDAGAATCKLINKDGQLDFNAHRGFPTPWNSFSYFSGLQKLFPQSKLFAGYTQGWQDLDNTHPVDAIEGAFLLLPYEIGEKIGWWDEDYFFYGEDLQMCYDIQQLGYKIYYVGEVNIMHIGGASSGIKKVTTTNKGVTTKAQKERFAAMRTFYQKNYEKKYPSILNALVLTGISALEKKVSMQS